MIMSRILITICLLLLCRLTSPATTLTGFRHITVNDGLPRNGVFAILPSSRGPVYIGTWDGLFVLNGSTVSEIIFTPSADSPVHTVNFLTEDSLGNIWVGTSRGLMKFNPATGSFKPIPESKGSITSLHCDDLNNIHFVENNRIYKILDQTDYSVSITDAKGRIAGYENLPEDTKIAFTDSRNRVLAATRNGDIFEAGSDHIFHKLHHCDAVASSIAEHNGKILFGSNDGLTVYDPATRRIEQVEIDYSNPNGINDRRITTLAVDDENGLWIGTFYGGINYLSPTPKNFYDCKELNSKLSGHVISGITRDSAGLLWFSIEDSGISSYNPLTGEVKNFTTRPDSPEVYQPATSNIQTIFAHETTLYVGTAGQGMDVIDLKTMSHCRFQGAVSETKLPASVYSFACDRNGLIWIGTMSGLFTFNPLTMQFSDVTDIPKAIFHCLVTDSDGTIWAPSQGAGLFSISPEGEIRHYQLPSDLVMSVCPIKNTIYAGTEGNGLFIIDKQTGQAKPLPASLPERLMVFSIIPDNEAVWFSTNKGLMYYSPENNQVEQYTEADGLRSNQHKINSALKLPDGQILIGSVSGIYSFHPKEILRNESLPTAYLTAIIHPQSELEADSTALVLNYLELLHDANSIEFQFASSSNADPAKNRFEFMLEPYQTTWQITDNRKPSATYANLEVGTYTFRLRTSNGNGLYSDERRITIVILPTTKSSLPLKITILILGILILSSAIFLLIRHKHQPRRSTFLHQPANTLSADDIPPAEADFLSKLNSVIDEHIDNSSLTVDDLASFMCMGRSSFFAKVKELTNQTPNDYLRAVRLKRAAALLELKTLRINEVAYRVGFASPSYFTRRFTAMYGVTPAEYQNAACKDPNSNQQSD